MNERDAPRSPCPGCGGLFHDIDGPTHRYLGASPGCWALYGEMLAGVYPMRPGRWASLAVDAYAAQHPGVDVPPARQSVALHLTTMHAFISGEIDAGRLIVMRATGAQWGHRNGFQWLEPAPQWSLSILDVTREGDLATRGKIADRWVEEVYQGWMAGFGPLIESWNRQIRAAMPPK